MQPEEHPCGLRRLSNDFYGTYGGRHLRHMGEAGPFWLFLMGLVRFRMARTARALKREREREAATQPARSRLDPDRAPVAASVMGNSIQKVVPAPVSVSNPMRPPIASTN